MFKKIWKNIPEFLFRGFVLFSIIGSIAAIRNYTAVSKLFAHKHTVVSGNGYILTDKILEIADFDDHGSLLDINLNEAMKRLSAYPFIKCQKISRVFPSTIRIDIVEREPFVRVKCRDGVAVIDRDGRIIPYDPMMDRSFDLPIIVGETEKVSMDELSSDENAPWIQCRTKLLFSIEQQLSRLFSASYSIGVENNQLIFRYFDGITNIRLDMNDCEQQTEKLVSFYHTVGKLRRLTDYKTIDLRIPGQVIVVENHIERS